MHKSKPTVDYRTTFLFHTNIPVKLIKKHTGYNSHLGEFAVADDATILYTDLGLLQIVICCHCNNWGSTVQGINYTVIDYNS